MPAKITRVYTGTGDKGTTSPAGGKRVSKGDQRIEACGSLDELNSFTGMARVFLAGGGEGLAQKPRQMMEELLERIQHELFDACGMLAAPFGSSRKGMRKITQRQVKYLEARIDGFQKELKPLYAFVLPGGSKGDAALHQCRTVCRRAERELVRLSRQRDVNPVLLKYLNRLGDLFFVMARYAIAQSGRRELKLKRSPGN